MLFDPRRDEDDFSRRPKLDDADGRLAENDAFDVEDADVVIV
jgi:hypothetical protein